MFFSLYEIIKKSGQKIIFIISQKPRVFGCSGHDNFFLKWTQGYHLRVFLYIAILKIIMEITQGIWGFKVWQLFFGFDLGYLGV